MNIVSRPEVKGLAELKKKTLSVSYIFSTRSNINIVPSFTNRVPLIKRVHVQ